MNDWTLTYNGWNPENQPLREALCALGNGYFVTRGAAEENSRSSYDYPGTYLAGGYDRAVSKVEGKNIENEDLVNWPNWLVLTFRHADEEHNWFTLYDVDVLGYTQNLNLKNGVLERKIRFRDNKNRTTSIVSKRVVSLHDAHVAAVEWTFIPEDWSGEIVVKSGIDGNVQNGGVSRYKDLESRHIDVLQLGVENEETIFLESQTRQSKIRMAQVVTTHIYDNGKRLNPRRQHKQSDEQIEQHIYLKVSVSQPICIEKFLSLFTSRDFAISDPLSEACIHTKRLKNFNSILADQSNAWKLKWKYGDINLKTGNKDQLIVRLHIFHLYQTVSHQTIGIDVGVPSRGWHGEAYRGHIFWDELYIFPFLNLHNPQLARSLLMYRYRRLAEAYQLAADAGFRGAMFPWQSGSNGREESQSIHLNPKSGRWIPDSSRLQRHINAAIPYNVWQYYQASNDKDFLHTFGAEIILATALFWSSIAKKNTESGKYEICNIMGPDEYHTGYPDAGEPGLNNNAYTNFMAIWVMKCALRVLDMLDQDDVEELSAKTGLQANDVETWRSIISNMYIPVTDEEIILQFDGFDELDELDWPRYRKEYGEVMRLDRILEKENDTPNRYRACKQADVLMLFYLFSSEELRSTFKDMGYNFSPGFIPKNIQYYQKITSHGSTLSEVIHSWVNARQDRNRSWNEFEKALMSDFQDVQGGTTPEGIHLGAMAGTIDLLQRCYTGLEIRDDVLWLNPRLPEGIVSLKLHIRYRSHWIKLDIDHSKIHIDFDRGWADPVEISVRGEKFKFETDDTKTIALS